ncbi:MAG: glycosyltransferase family 9 protein [Candidatus Zixiibacteriota bacterium]
MAQATGASLAYVTREEWAPLVRRHPAVDEVLTLPRRGERDDGAITGLIKRINDELRPEIVFDWHGVPRSRHLAGYLDAYDKVRYEKYGVRRWLLAAVGVDLLPRPMPRIPELYARTAARWGVKGPDWSFRLAEDPAAGERLARNAEIPRGAVALAPGARHGNKAWPAAHWAELARSLAAEGRSIILFGDERERELCGEIAGGVPAAVNLAGRVAVGDLPEALRGAALLVGNDSALNHLAPLVDVPCLALFGPTSPRFGFSPWGPKDRVIYLGLKCSPCSKHGRRPCWRVRRYCLEDVAPEEVVRGAREIMGEA